MQRVWSTYLDKQGTVVTADEISNRRPEGDVNARQGHRGSYSSSTYYPPSSAGSTTRLVMSDLPPPVAPFTRQGSSSPASYRSLNSSFLSPPDPSSLNGNGPVSLSVNYLPSKFSRPVSPSKGAYKRKGKKAISIPKRGGGREAFRSGEARMGHDDDDEYSPDGGAKKSKLRWNKFKWILFVTVVLLTAYSIVSLIICLLIWLNVWEHAVIIRVGNKPELILSTVAAAFGLLTSLVGWSGLLLNNRSFLAVYSLFTWITFALLVTPGYITYRRKVFNLEGKINSQWSRELGLDGRLKIQNALTCCGYFSPFVEATVSQTCFARSLIPGCKNPYLKYQRNLLTTWYAYVFGLVPAHLGVIVGALLCSNHVTYRFGKGMMPKAYRLSMNSMAVIMDNYANQLADQFGVDYASQLLAHSRSNLNLKGELNNNAGVPVPTVPYSSGTNLTGSSSMAGQLRQRGDAYTNNPGSAGMVLPERFGELDGRRS